MCIAALFLSYFLTLTLFPFSYAMVLNSVVSMNILVLLQNMLDHACNFSFINKSDKLMKYIKSFWRDGVRVYVSIHLFCKIKLCFHVKK